MITVQYDDFDVNKELNAIKKNHFGAVVSFLGTVRDFAKDEPVRALQLEHYPEMTTNQLHDVAKQAKTRWDNINDITIIHRVGKLYPGDNIVFIAVAGIHRRGLFQACEFILETLKKQVTFWKKEITDDHEYWVEPTP
jgi:molybdopterin synthase catalytic subunit